jgi:hypothetical protein
MMLTELAAKVKAVASDSHWKTRFWLSVTSSLTSFFLKLRVGSVCGSGLPPGPSCVVLVTLELELVARTLRAVKATRKKSSRKMG